MKVIYLLKDKIDYIMTNTLFLNYFILYWFHLLTDLDTRNSD